MTLISPSSALRGQLLKEEPLSRYTSWRTGGPADYVYIPADLNDLVSFLRDLPKSMPLHWLGLGSNTLIRDQGLDGVVVITQGALNKITPVGQDEIRVEAGVACAQFARHTARLSAMGLEFLAGIPGTMGGALAMNAGCFGGETWTLVTAVETIDRFGEIRKRQPGDFQVSYRHVDRPPEEWFIAGYFRLIDGDKQKSLEVIRTLLERRQNTQPTGTASCGSVFRNPPNAYAGRLIEECGLKGLRRGGALVSEKHANFILNEGKASSDDIEYLIHEVGAIVYEKTGVRLIPEVCIIGRT